MAQELIPQQAQKPAPIRLVGGPQTGVADDFRSDNTQGEFLRGWNAPFAAEDIAEAAAEVNAARQRGDKVAEAEHLSKMQELQASAQANAPRVSSLGQINNFGDAVDYGKQLSGGVIPGAIKPVLGGTGGALLGAALGAKFKLGAGARALFGTGGALGAMLPGQVDSAIQQHVVAGDQQSPDEILKQSRIQAVRQLAPFAFGGGAVQQVGNRMAGNVAQGVVQKPLGQALGASMLEQGALAAASTKIGQFEQDRWNSGRDRSGDNMELLDSAASNALGGGLLEAPGHAAQGFHQTRRNAQAAIGALAQEGVRVAPGIIDKGIAKAKNSLGIAGDAINEGVDQAAVAADNALANAPKSVAEAAGMASGRSRNAIDELLRDKSSDFAQQPEFADLFTPLKGDVDAKSILAQTDAKNKAAEAFANYTLSAGDNAPPYVKAAAEEYLAGPKTYDSWHTSGLADAANIWEQSRKRSEAMASIYTSLGGAGAKALAQFQNGREQARSEGPFTSTPQGIEKRYNDIYNALSGVSDPAKQHAEAKWLLDVEQAVGRYKNDKPVEGDDAKIAWYRAHPTVFDELPANKSLQGMHKALFDNHGELTHDEKIAAFDSFGELQRNMDKRNHLRKLQNPDLQFSLEDAVVPKTGDRTTQPNPLEATTPGGLRNNAVPEAATLSDRLFQLEQHNNRIFQQAYARAATPQAKEILLQKFGLKAPPVKGELPYNQRLDSYTDSKGNEVRHQSNLGVNRAPMSEKDWVAISGGKLQATGAGVEVGRTPQTNQSAATEGYNKNLYAQQRKTYGSPGEKAKTREIESSIGRTEASNQREYQQQKALVETLRTKIKDDAALLRDPAEAEVAMRDNPTLREAESKLDDLGKQLVVKEVKPLSDTRFNELMGKFPELTEGETSELTAHAPYLIDSLRLKTKLTPRDEAHLRVASELITHAAREKQRFDRVQPQTRDGVKYKRFEDAWGDVSATSKDDPFNKALTTALAQHYPHQHVGAQQHDLPAHALGLRLWIGNGLDTKAPRRGENGKLFVNPKGHIQGLDRMASVWGSASKARDALDTTYNMMVHEGLIPNEIRPAVAERIKRSKQILSQQHYANRELGNLVLQTLKPSVLAQLGGGLEAAKHLANQIIRAVNEQGDPDKVFDSPQLKAQFEKLFGERAEQTRQAFWLAYKGREERAAQELFKQAGEGVGGETGRVAHEVGTDSDGNTTLRDADNALGRDGDIHTSDAAVWARGDDSAEFNNSDGGGDANDNDLANMTNAMAPTTVAPPKAKFHHHTQEKKVKYDQMEGGGARRRFHDVFDPGQNKRVASILESPGFDKARLDNLREQDDLNNMAIPYIKGFERKFEKSGATVRHDEQLAKAIADIKARGVSDAKAVGYIDYLKEKFGVPDTYDAENPPDSVTRFDAAVAQIIKRFGRGIDSPETKIEIENALKLFDNPDWVEKQRAKGISDLTREKDALIADIRRKKEANSDKVLSQGLNPYAKEALDEINRKLFVIKEEAKNDAFDNTGMRIDSSEFESVNHASSSNYWGVSPGADGERSHASAGGIWLRRASDGKVFMTTADKIVQRARKAMFAAGETQNVKGAKATRDLFAQGLSMLFESEDAHAVDATGDSYQTKASVTPEIGIFDKPLDKYQRGDVQLTPIDKLVIPNDLKIGDTTWGALTKNARESTVADDRAFLRTKQKELTKQIAELERKQRDGVSSDSDDWEFANAQNNHTVVENALRFEELNAKAQRLKNKLETKGLTAGEREAYNAVNDELRKLYDEDKARQTSLDHEGIEKRIVAQQKVVADIRNGLSPVDKTSLGAGVTPDEAARLHADYEAHIGAGGNRKTGLPQIGVDPLRDHPEAVKLRDLQALYDAKYDALPGKTASLADAVTYLNRWKDDQQAVYDHDDDAKRVVDARWDAEYKSVRPFKGETKDAAIARNERRKFNNQKAMLSLVEGFYKDTVEHEGGKSVTHSFDPAGMVKALGGGWRALNESRAETGKTPVDKVTYLQSEMDLVRSLINEPDTSSLWDKYNPNYALPKINSGKKDRWGAAKEQVIRVSEELRNAHEVANMTQKDLREAKVNYDQVLADAKPPGSPTSEVHVKAFAKNLQGARERFQAALDNLRTKQTAFDVVELTHQHLVDEYNENVKDRADEIHRLKSGLQALVKHVDGLVNGRTLDGKRLHGKDSYQLEGKVGTPAYGVGVRGVSDTAKTVTHKIVDKNGNDVLPAKALNDGYVFQRGQFFRIEDGEGKTVAFKDAKSREVDEKAMFNAVPVGEKEALKDGFSHNRSSEDIIDESGKKSVQQTRTGEVGRRIDLAAKAEDTEIYKRIAKENGNERSYQEETGEALGVHSSPDYVKSSLDKKTLDIARNLARSNPDFDPKNAKGGWTQEMVDAWNAEKAKMDDEYARNVTYKRAAAWLEETGVPAAVALVRKKTPESQAHYLAMFDKLASGGRDVWGASMPSDKLRGKFQAVANALRRVEEARGPIEKQMVMWGKGADAGKVVAVRDKDGVYRNSMGHEVLVTDTNTHIGGSTSPLTNTIGSGQNELGVKLPVNEGVYGRKDAAKSAQATQFIGVGAPGSSTAKYAKAWGDRANTGAYGVNDRVFVSMNGARPNAVPLEAIKEHLNAAMSAGATIIADAPRDRNRPYNVGERDLANYLSSAGYVEKNNDGIWSMKNDKPLSETSTPKNTVSALIGGDTGVRETMLAVKELVQNPLGAENPSEKFNEAKDYIKGKLKELRKSLSANEEDPALLNRQERFSRAFAAVSAAESRFNEGRYIRTEGYPDMTGGERGVMSKRLKAEERALVASGDNPERLEAVRKMLDMAQKKSKRIAPTEELTSVAAKPKRLDLMLGEANAAHVFSPPSEEVVQAMRDSVERRFGDRIRAIFEAGDTVTHDRMKATVEKWEAGGVKQKAKGLWSSAENLIKVALSTQNPTQTLDHESFHAFYSGMVEGGVLTEGARKILVNAANSEYVRKRLDALFPENKLQHIDRGFGNESHSTGVTNAESERMANMFAMWRAGELTLAPAPRNIFAKIWGKLRSVLGILREEDKADVILKAFDAGDLKTNEAVHALYENISSRERLITEVNRWTRPIAVVAQRLALTAEANLDRSGVMFSPEYKKIRRLFKKAVGEGGDNGYLDAKDQMMKKFSNMVAAPFRDLEPGDMPRLANALAGGYEHPTTAIGKAREALIGENGIIRKIDKYMAEAGVQYLAGVDEKTGKPIWKEVEVMPAGSMPKSLRVNDVMSRGDEFVADLWTHNHKEMTDMFNSVRAKFDLAVDQVRTQEQELADFNRAVVQRVINTFGQLHIPELTTDIGMSPIMQALNSRAISWVHPEVYKKWGENDVVRTFTSYASQAVKLAESVRRFGNGNAKLHDMLQKGKWEGLRKEIQHSFKVDIGETPPEHNGTGEKKPSMFDLAEQAIYEARSLNAVEKETLTGIFNRITDVAKKAGTDVAGMQGLLGYDINPTLRKMQNSMLVYQNLRSLSTSLLSQFIDPLNLVVRGATMGEAWSAYKRGLREVVASIKGEEIRDLDLTIAEHVGTVGAHGFLGTYGQLYSSEHMGNWFRKANDFLFRYNGMEGFNRGMQVAATRSAINFIKRHVEKPGKNSASYLAEIGLRAEKVKINEHGELDYDDPRIQRAIYQWVSGAVMRPNASQRPAYASDPHYMVFWHMKQFAYTFHDSIMKRAIHDYKKYGDTGPLGVMATCFAPVMIAVDVAKSVLLTGDAPGWWKSGLPDIIEHGVNRAGLSGRYQPVVDIAVTPGRSWLGLGGPMIEQLQQLGDQTLGQSVVSALPGQNVIKQVFGIGGVEALNTPED